MIKVSDYVVKYLEDIGVEYVFTVVGGGSMFLNNSFANSKKIECVYFHHEQAAAIAAEGYARVSGKLGVVCITTGPGGLNTLTGVMGAWTDSVPVLFISGQVKREHITNFSTFVWGYRQIGDQEVDITEVVKPLTKSVRQIREPKYLKQALKQAVWNTLFERPGPTWIDIPIDVQNSELDDDSTDTYLPSTFLCPSHNEYKELYGSLLKAKRPLIVAGKGVNISNTRNEFLQFAEKLNIPVVTTFTGFDIIPSDHPLYVGRCSTVGTRAGNFAVQNADFILFLGTRNNIRQIGYNKDFAENAYKVCVDIDWNELNKPTIEYDLKICADLKTFFKYFSCNYKQDNSRWLNHCLRLKEKYPVVLPEHRESDLINPYHLIEELTKQLKEDAVVVCGNGTACVAPFQAAVVKKGQKFIINSGCAAMGYAIPAAIGACLANDKKEVVCIDGDGSIMMNLQELQTIKHYNLPIKIFLLNNSGYGSIKQTQNNFFNGNLAGCDEDSGVSFPDFEYVARAFEIRYTYIDALTENIGDTINFILGWKVPYICEVVLDSNYIFQPKCSSQRLEDGTIVSKAYDDMSPFLDREEYEDNKIVK